MRFGKGKRIAILTGAVAVVVLGFMGANVVQEGIDQVGEPVFQGRLLAGRPYPPVQHQGARAAGRWQVTHQQGERRRAAELDDGCRRMAVAGVVDQYVDGTVPERGTVRLASELAKLGGEFSGGHEIVTS